MARYFHLVCSGRLDPSHSRSFLTSRLAEVLSDPIAIEAVMASTAIAKRIVTLPDSTLIQARALDAELLARGFISKICYAEREAPSVSRVFLDQRHSARRSRMQPITPIEQRASRERRFHGRI